MPRFSPRSKGYKLHVGLPNLGVVHQENEHPKGLAFKGSRACVWEGCRKQILHFKRVCKISHALSPSAQAVISKEPGSAHLLILESLLERQEATGTHPGDTDAGSNHFGELIVPGEHWLW